MMMLAIIAIMRALCDQDDQDDQDDARHHHDKESQGAPWLWSAKPILGFSGAQLSPSNQYNQDGHGKPQVYLADNNDDDDDEGEEEGENRKLNWFCWISFSGTYFGLMGLIRIWPPFVELVHVCNTTTQGVIISAQMMVSIWFGSRIKI